MFHCPRILNFCARKGAKFGSYKRLQWKYLPSYHAELLNARLSTFSRRNQTQATTHMKSKSSIMECHLRKNYLEIYFDDGVSGCAPFLWLRDNCQCPECFDRSSLGRKLMLKDLRIDSEPVDLLEEDGVLRVKWNDGHLSTYSRDWLYYRSFTPKGKETYDNLFHLKKETWGKEHKVSTYDYNVLWKDNQALFEWLVAVEKQGAALITNTPCVDDAGVDFLDRIAFVKKTHFGLRSPVKNRPGGNNLAFSPVELSLHSDLTSYDYQPGLIFLQMVKQCEGDGGDSTISDGFFTAQLLKEKHPDEYKMLTTTDVSFWDKGVADIQTETNCFYKMNKGPTIRLDNSGNVCRISHNSQIRDTFFDLPYDQVNDFYRALKLFDRILNENCVEFKMNSGDMLVLDNCRCLHGRGKFNPASERHLETFYFDWDEALSRRRVLKEQFLNQD